ncbi:hypothetical protein [Brachymonas sp.]|uniref:hypothetical protein n=1 Tax=Brachymonas sp. TaxID=1936292 RepID=UPI0035AF6E8E
MGFWSSVGNVAKSVAGRVEAAGQEANVIAEDYRQEDDDYLKRKLRSGKATEKMAAAKVLKERGYGNQG